MSSFRWLAYLSVLVVVACSPAPDSGSESGPDATTGTQTVHTISDSKKKQGALLLSYIEKEPGIDPYENRIIITPDFLRMDDGTDESDFTLFNRREKVIYSVSHDSRSALVLRELASDIKSPLPLKLDEQQVEMSEAPLIEGKTPLHYRLLVNDQLCRDTIVVPDLHVEAIQAMREFRQVLASVHKANVPNTPDDMQDPCFLADDVFWHNRSLKYGFPIREWTPTGFSRSLVDYKFNVPTSAGIFMIPEGYLRTTAPGGAATDT